MITEIKKSKTNPFLIVTIMIIAFITISYILNITVAKYNLLLKDLIFYTIFGVVFSIFIRYFLTTFEYKLENNVLYISKTLGRRTQPLFEANLSNIKNLKPFDEKIKFEGRKANFCATLNKKDRFSFETNYNDKPLLVIFEPSKEFCNSILSSFIKNGGAKNEN